MYCPAVHVGKYQALAYSLVLPATRRGEPSRRRIHGKQFIGRLKRAKRRP